MIDEPASSVKIDGIGGERKLAFTIRLHMKDEKEAERLDREINLNDYAIAIATFETVAKGMFGMIYPTGYILELIDNQTGKQMKKLEDF